MTRTRVTILLLAGALISGCGREPERESNRRTGVSQNNSATVGSAVAEARNLLALGCTNDAISLLTGALDDVSDAEHRAEVFSACLFLLAELGDRERLEAATADCLKRCAGPKGRIAVRTMVLHLLYKENREAAEGILELVRNMASEKGDLRALGRVIEIDLLLYDKQFNEAMATVKASVEYLSDGDIATALDRLYVACSNEEDMLVLDGLCGFLVENAGEKVSAVGKAARIRIETPVKRADWPDVNNRLLALLKANFNTGQIFRSYEKVFYTCAENGDEQSRREFIQIGKEIYSRLTDPHTKRMLATLILDGGFILGDYDLALDVLDRGVPGESEEWHAMIRTKLVAHKHEAAGRNKEAVAEYRKFMKFVEDATSDYQPDPVNESRVSNWVILGFNARRIGELLAADGENEEADRAFSEARIHYLRALELVEDKASREYREIESALASVPKGAAFMN